MSDIELTSSEIDRDVYLRGLNECFHGWGEEALYAWCFERDAGAGVADQMVATIDDDVVGGSAVVYRCVEGVGGAKASVGIMCGSWTLPASRGRGCFSRMIERSVALSKARGAALLIAFVTETNPSKRRLEAAGSLMVPTGYCVAEVADDGSALVSDGNVAQADPRAAQAASGVRFVYGTQEAWGGQWIKRPSPNRAVALPSGATAIVEEAADTDRVLALFGSQDRLADLEVLRRDAAARGRKTFFFSTVQEELSKAPNHGFKVIPGYVTVLVADEDACGAWLGQRVVDAKAATDLLGGWFLEHGDRM